MNKKWAVKRLTLNLTTEEMKKLEKYSPSSNSPEKLMMFSPVKALEFVIACRSEPAPLSLVLVTVNVAIDIARIF